MAHDVFISYPHQDKATADAVCAKLEAEGIRCWIAPRDIAPSADWAASIVEAIENCRVMVLIFSAHANQSKQVHREVQQAFDEERPVLPFRIENIAPDKTLRYYMASVHWLDALTPPLEQHLQKLAVSVQALVRATTSDADRQGGQIPWQIKENWNNGRKARHWAWRTSLIGCALGIVAAGTIGLWFANMRVAGPVAEVTAAADRGDPAAQNELGLKYAEGTDGLPHDDAKAVEWYRKAAVQGYPAAETNLGDMYLFGRGDLDKDPLEALSWYLKAAQQHWPDAQYRLGYMYEVGLGTAKNVQRAAELYRSAANAGYPDAENVLGVLYATGGDGLPKDDKQAVEWYRKAAEQGFAKAEKNLGDMFFSGRGVERDYKQAIFWYTKAADQQDANAQYQLGYIYEKGLGTDQSEKNATEQYKKAARHGNVDAQRALDRLESSRTP